jgi:hypothetical protein
VPDTIARMKVSATLGAALAAFVALSLPEIARADEESADSRRDKTGSIVLRATDAEGHDIVDATAEIDGNRTVPVNGRSVELDPGKHTIKITRPSGGVAFEDVILVAQGEKDRVVVAKLLAKKDDAKHASKVPPASVIAWTVGGIALLTFAGFGLKARVDYDDYEALCGNRCADSERDTVATSVLVADVSLVVAVVAASVGTYFFVTRPSRQETR